MKKYLLVLCCLLGVATAQAQNDDAAMVGANMMSELKADSISSDSTDVLAFFCNRDTMEYRFMATKREINGTDTVFRSAYAQDFMLCITDSTDEGYRMEYVATDFDHEDTIKVDPQVSSSASRVASWYSGSAMWGS